MTCSTSASITSRCRVAYRKFLLAKERHEEDVLGQRALQDIDELITGKTVDMRRFFRQDKRGWRDQGCLWRALLWWSSERSSEQSVGVLCLCSFP